MTTRIFCSAFMLRVTALCSLIFPLLLPSIAHAQAYTLTTLANFDGMNGQYPKTNLTLDANGNLYGTTNDGGGEGSQGGTAFEIVADTNTINKLGTFNYSNGSLPSALTIANNGGLYGTTSSGGANGVGTVFKLAAGGNGITTLYNFKNKDVYGEKPYGGLALDSNGDLYGTTSLGGDLSLNGGRGYGTVFKISAGTNGSSLTTVASFNGTTGINPVNGVTIDSDGNLYGTATGGLGYGTIFKVTAGNNTITTLANFDSSNGTNGASLTSLTIDSQGNLYGATSGDDGLTGYGTIFKVAAGTNTITTLARFNKTNGSGPNSVVLDSMGNLFGTTSLGGEGSGSGKGTVFEIAAGTSTITTLAFFNGANGSRPFAGLTLDNQGDLYGTTYFGGNLNLNSGQGLGTVFKLSPVSVTVPESGTLALLGLTVPIIGIVRRRATR